MSTKKQKYKRESKQVRIPIEWHKLLKIEAAENDTTVIKLLVEILNDYYKIYKSEANQQKH